MKQAEVTRLELSSERLRALTQPQKYVFALTGHIFNELILLQKWIHVAPRPPGTYGPQEDAAVGISMFLLRMLSAKVHEALNVLNKSSVSEVMHRDYFPHHPGLKEKWGAALAQHHEMSWLKRVRDRGAFHYMNSAQLGPHLDEAFAEGAYCYVGKRYGDMYFHCSEMAVAMPAMREVNANEPFEGLGQMLDDLGGLLSHIVDCLALGIQAFIDHADLVASVAPPTRFDAPEFEPSSMHYFFADERLQPN